MSLKSYTSVQEFMQERRDWLKRELNNFPPYIEVVRRLRYHMIGGVVMDEQGNERCRWASLNNNSGRITEIINFFNMGEPDFVVKAAEPDLLAIINDFEYLKVHPFAAIHHHYASFRPGRTSDVMSLPQIILLALAETAKYSLSYPQTSS